MSILIVGNGKMGRAVAALAEASGPHDPRGDRRAGERGRPGAHAGAAGRRRRRDRVHQARCRGGQPRAADRGGRAHRHRHHRLAGGASPYHRPRRAARDGALLHASNFSVGVHLFLRAAHDLARRFAGQPTFDAFILEEHHAAKRDAPSGTARELQRGLRGGRSGRATFPSPRCERAIRRARTP